MSASRFPREYRLERPRSPTRHGCSIDRLLPPRLRRVRRPRSSHGRGAIVGPMSKIAERMRWTLVPTCVLLLSNAALPQPPRTRVDPPAGGMAVVLLGTGIPLPNPARGTAATLVLAGEQSVLVDTGRGAMVSLAGTGRDDVS